MFPFRKNRPDPDLPLTVLRFGLGSSFLWFGIDKLIHAERWLAWVPNWGWLLALVVPSVLIVSAGLLEFMIGLALIDGRYGRLVPAIASLWMVLTVSAWGVTDTTIRDAGLLGIGLALLVMADRKAESPWPKLWMRYLGYAYIIFLLFVGIIFLRHS